MSAEQRLNQETMGEGARRQLVDCEQSLIFLCKVTASET